MTLGKYLEQKHMTVADFAQEVGVTPQSVYRYVRGDHYPTASIMARIFRATNRQVTPNDFVLQEA